MFFIGSDERNIVLDRSFIEGKNYIVVGWVFICYSPLIRFNFFPAVGDDSLRIHIVGYVLEEVNSDGSRRLLNSVYMNYILL